MTQEARGEQRSVYMIRRASFYMDDTEMEAIALAYIFRKASQYIEVLTRITLTEVHTSRSDI